jgi:hypothetical protein
MPKNTLYLVTYDRGRHPLTGQPKPHHWAYFLDTTTNDTTTTTSITTSPPPTSDTPHSPAREAPRQEQQQQQQPRGLIFQLRGMPGGFHYPGPERLDAAQGGEPGPVREMLEVGQVDAGDVAAVREVLAGVQVVQDEGAAWNCQDWALTGLVRLKERGWVYEGIGGEGVVGWLRGLER